MNDHSGQPTSTTGSGARAPSDRHSLTVGPDGPMLLHDVHFLEQVAHFNPSNSSRSTSQRSPSTPACSTA